MDIVTRAEAKAAGKIRYFTGKPCPQGHVTERNVLGQTCVGCQQDRYRNLPEEKRTAVKAAVRARYRTNREEINRRAKQYSDAHWDQVLETSRRWRARNPLKRRAFEHKRLARKAAAEGRYSHDDVVLMLNKQLGRCNACHVDISNRYTVDHIAPLTRGGTNWPNNLQLLCQPCNSSKGNKTMDEWMAISKRPLERRFAETR